MIEINKEIHTSCKNCVFALYQKDTQIDCKLYRLDQFKKNHAEVLEAYDKDKEFFIVNNRKCAAYRDKLWKESLDTDVEIVDIIIKELEITCDILIYADKDTQLEDFKNTIQSISESTLKPNFVNIVNNYIDIEEIILNRYYMILQKYLKGICKYKLTNILEEDIPYERAVDICLKQFDDNDMWFLTMHSGRKLPKKLLSSINYAINIDLKEIVLILPNKDNDFLFSQIEFYRNLCGNKFGHFTKLAQKHIEKFQCQHLITKIEKICRSCQ